MQSILRTAVAILCGFLAMSLVVLSGTIVATTLFITGGLETVSRPDTPLPALYLAANLGISLVAALLGGWLASRLDPPGGWRPVIGMAVLVLVMSVANQAVPRSSSGTPVAWYPWALVVIGVVGSLTGGWLRLRSQGVGAAVSTSAASSS
ncbi:MAG TPA: hypothetical protein VFO66_13975 [Gemmatimonadaceae bacterium]|nr:hypothetical protein [Gemmatimonadaceae bacterium]